MAKFEQGPSAVTISVVFYNEDHRERLLKYPTADRILRVVENGVVVPTAQLLTYYLFHKKLPSKPGWRSYDELSQRLAVAMAELDGWIDFADGTIVAASDAVPQIPAITERMGEAIGLSVVNAIHNLHEADWERIPTHSGRNGFPTFDYVSAPPPTASDGELTVQVEAKGSSVADTADFQPSIRTQKQKIDRKKDCIAGAADYKYPADVRYGTIGAIGRSGTATCWITDPPSSGGMNARRVRLLSRMRFLLEWIAFLKGRSQLASALATRIRALERLEDPFVLDEVPLVESSGEEFAPTTTRWGERSSFLTGLSRVTDGPIGGALIPLPETRFLFLGVQEEIFSLAASQRFRDLMTYDNIAVSAWKNIDCVLSRSRADRLGLSELASRTRGNVRFQAEGVLHLSRGGLAFGVVSPERY